MKGYLIAILMLKTFATNSQTIIPRFETLGVNEGLSQNSVYAIYQDKEGFMWFGTGDGLNRYDGDEIKVYKTKSDLNKKGNSNLIRGRLCEDQKGNIWFSTESGLYYYDKMQDMVKEGFLFPELSSGILYYYLLGVDDDQTLWLLNRHIGVVSFRTTDREWKKYEYSFTPDFSQLSDEYMTMDEENNIWYSWYINDGMLKFDTKKKKYESIFRGKDFSSVCFGKGKYYISNKKFIYRYDSLTSVTDSFRTDHHPLFNFVDSYGNLWSSKSDEGLLYFDFASRKSRQYLRSLSGNRSLSSNIIRTLFEDRSGNLWIGTDGGGVCKLDLKPPFFNLFPMNEGDYPAITDYFIKSLYEDREGRIWFGTLKGFNIYSHHDGSIRHFDYQDRESHSLQGNIVSSLFRDKEGNTWIGHDRGISLFDERNGTLIPVYLELSFEIKPFSTFIHQIMQLKNGILLAATSAQILMIKKEKDGKYKGTSKFYNIKDVPGAVTWIIEQPNGNLWFTSNNAGLFFSSFMHDTLIIKENFFPGVSLRSVHIDKTNPIILWLASGKGLIRFDTETKKYQLFNESSGMANSYVYGILEDEKHNFWMSTNGGLIYFNRKTNLFQNYTVNEGLQSNEFNSGAFYKGESGNFYFGGVKGFNWFRSGNFPKSKGKPGVGVTSILVENIPYLKDSLFYQHKTIRLNYLQNDLVFQVAAFDYTRPQANKIQYMMKGWDDDWITTYDKQIRYRKLMPGQYTLVIRASNNMGEWSEDEKITIIMNAPFWQRTWFYIICGVLLIGIVILITRNLAQRKIKERVRQLEKQQAIETERNRISKDMHDEIGSGLTRIALMTELMNAQKQLDEKTKHDVDEIATSTRKLVETMSEIIWALNPHNDKLESLLSYLREQTQYYFEPLPIDYKIHFPDIVPDITLSNEQRRNLFLVSKEALNNALKHSAASCIEIIAIEENGKIKFSVVDNGKGFNEGKKRIGANGLKNMQQRMKDINGEIEWISQNGKGTIVNYWINI